MKSIGKFYLILHTSMEVYPSRFFDNIRQLYHNIDLITSSTLQNLSKEADEAVRPFLILMQP